MNTNAKAIQQEEAEIAADVEAAGNSTSAFIATVSAIKGLPASHRETVANYFEGSAYTPPKGFDDVARANLVDAIRDPKGEAMQLLQNNADVLSGDDFLSALMDALGNEDDAPDWSDDD